jgi:lysophospholipase L1-like esterase
MTPSGSEQPYCYVALGDSISIDEYAGGRGRGGASLLAANRDADFPPWRCKDLRALHEGLRYQLLASDGATSHALLESQLPRVESSGMRPAVVTLTVGGNDLLGAYGDTARARQLVRSVRARVEEALGRLRRLMPAADDPVIVGPSTTPATAAARLHGWGCRRGRTSSTCSPS